MLITKSSSRTVNYVTITGTLSWYKILPLNGNNLIRAKTRLHRKRNSACGISSSHQKNPKVIYTDTLWNLQNPLKILHGIIGRQHFIDLRRMASLSEQYEFSRKEHQLYLLCHFPSRTPCVSCPPFKKKKNSCIGLSFKPCPLHS